ncbi:MAG TPA: O-antigen ligase family protein [Thermoanaerobaculia bacterium]|nr:O-antigen ligase family protein [Thermoanaerobaculia bacterium]
MAGRPKNELVRAPGEGASPSPPAPPGRDPAASDLPGVPQQATAAADNREGDSRGVAGADPIDASSRPPLTRRSTVSDLPEVPQQAKAAASLGIGADARWRWRALVPALWLALFAGWCGNLLGAVTAAGSAAGAAALLGGLLALGASWRDPLRLGRAGRLLPPALWAAAAASAWLSPVPRAGRVGVLLLPVFLSLPAAVARCWRREPDRRVGLRAVAAAVAAVALWSLLEPLGWRLLEMVPFDFARTLAPLGHHTLLAVWLVTLLPLGVLPLREAGRWRMLGAGAGLLAAAAVLASRSLLGGLSLAMEACAGALWLLRLLRLRWPLWPPWSSVTGRRHPGDRQRRAPAALELVAVVALMAVIATAAALLLPRVTRITAGRDRSAQARAVYYRAGWEGFLARPLLGWGPGSAAWTAAAFSAARPGINPWGEAVGELHSLPVEVAYELGLAGLSLALALGALFGWRRCRELSRPSATAPGGTQAAGDPGLLLAGLVGLVGAAVALLGSAALAVTALPLALAVAAGAALAGGSCSLEERRQEREGLRLPARTYAVAAACLLAPAVLAQWHYDRAIGEAQAGRLASAKAELAAAVGLDPRFPLYRARLALLLGGSAEERRDAAQLSFQAAQDGGAVATLWLLAGLLGRTAERPWAARALETSCWLDPLDPFPPFYLAVIDPDGPRAPRFGAQALAADPRLAGAVFWQSHAQLYARALDEIGRRQGMAPGWVPAFLRAAPAPAPSPGPRRGPPARLELELDGVSYTESLSVHIFRRRPWPAFWPLVELRPEALAALRALPSAAALATTSPVVFRDVCADPRAHGDVLGDASLLSR